MIAKVPVTETARCPAPLLPVVEALAEEELVELPVSVARVAVAVDVSLGLVEPDLGSISLIWSLIKSIAGWTAVFM